MHQSGFQKFWGFLAVGSNKFPPPKNTPTTIWYRSGGHPWPCLWLVCSTWSLRYGWRVLYTKSKNSELGGLGESMRKLVLVVDGFLESVFVSTNVNRNDIWNIYIYIYTHYHRLLEATTIRMNHYQQEALWILSNISYIWSLTIVWLHAFLLENTTRFLSDVLKPEVLP